MELLSLILYGGINAVMVGYHLLGHARFYQFPFWAGILALGWFFPQAIGGYFNAAEFPDFAYADGMFFAAVCSVALWLGFELAYRHASSKRSGLDAPFDVQRLYYAGAALCIVGFFFQWKLWSLPEEMLAQTQWSGVTVKYQFFASVFKIGFITLWLLYLSQPQKFVPRLLIFIIPCLLLFIESAILRGRRANMMNLVAYVAVSLWLVRRVAIPRMVVVGGLVCGLILVNGIGAYRAILKEKDRPLSERLSDAAKVDYLSSSRRRMNESGEEFKNYIYSRQYYEDSGAYDLGGYHWDRLVFNFVPAQIVGRETKKSLMIDPGGSEAKHYIKENYGHAFKTGMTTTGYRDAFGSFSWFGCAKFLLIGYLMGVLYRHAMQGAFLGQLLYAYALTRGMQAVSHGTHDILARIWVYFFVLAYPVLFLAKIRRRTSEELES